MNNQCSQLASRLDSSPWAMEPNALRRLAGRVKITTKVESEPEPLKPVMIEAAREIQAAKLDVPRSSGAVVVLPLRGVIEQHASWYADITTDAIGALLTTLAADDKIGAIVLQWDSPGGIVFGVMELAEQIRNLRTVKPIYSIADAEMYSAAYWLGTSATKTFVTPSGGVGSVGVWSAHMDASKAFEEAGVKITLVSAGKYKVEGNPWEPLSAEGRDAMQTDVNAYYDMFAEGVAKNRGKRVATIKAGFGEGRTVLAQPALEEGMVDGIATLTELIAAIVPKRRGGSVAAAELLTERAEAGMES